MPYPKPVLVLLSSDNRFLDRLLARYLVRRSPQLSGGQGAEAAGRGDMEGRFGLAERRNTTLKPTSDWVTGTASGGELAELPHAPCASARSAKNR
jgi:hypothetical protein